MARSKRGGATIGSAVSSVAGSTTTVGSTTISSVAGWSPKVGAIVETSPLGLFEVSVLGLALFIWACHCLRKVAPIEAVILEGKLSNPRKSKTL